MIEIRTAQDTIVELHPYELELLLSIRNKWRFGEITIIARDGLPVRIRRVTEFLDMAEEAKK